VVRPRYAPPVMLKSPKNLPMRDNGLQPVDAGFAFDAPFVDLLPIHLDELRRRDTQANSVSTDRYHGNLNVIADDDRFADTPRQNQHLLSSLLRVGKARPSCPSPHHNLLRA